MDFIAAVVAIVAIVLVIKLRSRMTLIEQHVALINQRLATSPRRAAGSSAPGKRQPRPPRRFASLTCPDACRTDETARTEQPSSSEPSSAAAPSVIPPPPSPAPLPAPEPREKLRRALRRELGGVDRRARARPRRHLHGAVFDRGRADRSGRSRVPRRAARDRADCGRRVDAACQFSDFDCSPAMRIIRFTTIARTGRLTNRSVIFIGLLRLQLDLMCQEHRRLRVLRRRPQHEAPKHPSTDIVST